MGGATNMVVKVKQNNNDECWITIEYYQSAGSQADVEWMKADALQLNHDISIKIDFPHQGSEKLRGHD